jgi:phosphatidylserine/phosphatidylglycerophosphate/cardiolipin synthase-like enzyme
MRRLTSRTFCPRLQLLLVFIGFFTATPALASPEIQVCFTPEYGSTPSCTQDIVNAIDSARHTILVQAYSFTSVPIAKALIEAHRRGVAVKVILDKRANTQHYSAATFLEHMGVPVWIDAQHAIAHNKVMVIDDATVISGSFNFTKAAEEHNAENLLIIHDPALVAHYTENWNQHLAHSQPYNGVAGQSGSQTSNHEEHQAEAGEVASKPSSATGVIVGNRNSHIYAWPGCRTYNKMAATNRIVFSSVQTAKQAGYRAARDCP